jgi:hypothetical protein
MLACRAMQHMMQQHLLAVLSGWGCGAVANKLPELLLQYCHGPARTTPKQSTDIAHMSRMC